MANPLSQSEDWDETDNCKHIISGHQMPSQHCDAEETGNLRLGLRSTTCLAHLRPRL